jgi:hypothetical protein
VSALLESAVAALVQHLGDPRAQDAVDRVEVETSGVLHLTLSAASRAGSARWFRFDARGLAELAPADDPRVPGARSLVGREDATVLSWRPSRRLVVLSRSPGRSGWTSPRGLALRGEVVAKAYRQGRARDAERRHRLAELAASPEGFRVATLLACDLERETLLLERLAGEAPPIGMDRAESFFRIGIALRSFQDSPLAGDLASFGPAEDLAVLDRWEERARVAVGGTPTSWDEARGRLTRAALELPALEPCLVHRDLHDGQILETESGLALVDFDLLARGDTALDAANLLAHLSLRGLTKERGADEPGAAAAADALLDGLARNGEAFWIKLRFYQAATFLRLSLIYSLRPRFAPVARPLLELARRCLSDLARIA